MMNGIERIIQQIEEAAQGEIDRILAEARTEADGVAAGYKNQLAREQADLTAKGEKAAAEREQRLISAAQMEARKKLLTARQEMVEAAYDRALEKLCNLPDEQYAQVLAALLVQAAPEGECEVIFAAKDKARAGEAAVAKANKKLGGKLSLSQETRPLRGGFVLKSQRVEVNCAFDTLVRLQKSDTAGAVAGILFP